MNFVILGDFPILGFLWVLVVYKHVLSHGSFFYHLHLFRIKKKLQKFNLINFFLKKYISHWDKMSHFNFFLAEMIQISSAVTVYLCPRFPRFTDGSENDWEKQYQNNKRNISTISAAKYKQISRRRIGKNLSCFFNCGFAMEDGFH